MLIPEPFTLTVAAFGIIATVLNAAINVPENVSRRRERYKKCRDDLVGYATDMRRCFDKMHSFQPQLMSGGTFVLAKEYDRVAGAGGHQRLKAQIQLLEYAVDDLYHSLAKDSMPHNAVETSHQVHFEDEDGLLVLAEDKPFTNSSNRAAAMETHLGSAAPTRWYRMSYSFLRSDKLKSTVEKLEKEVKRLEDVIEDARTKVPRHLQSQASEKPRLAQQIRQLRDMDNRWAHFSSMVAAVQISQPCVQWRLLIRFPDDEGRVECIQKDEDVTCSFLRVQYRIDSSSEQRDIVYISQSRAKTQCLNSLAAVAEMSGGRELRGHRSDVETETPSGSGCSLRNLYDYFARRNDIERTKCRKQHEREFLDIALGLVSWALLLWDTQWPGSIISCQLWRYKQGGHLVALCPKLGDKRCHCHAWCYQSDAGEGRNSAAITRWKCRLLGLGVILSELALMAPVKPIVQGTSLQFEYENSVLHREDLLERIRDFQGSAYKRATHKCFQNWQDAAIMGDTLTIDAVLGLSKEIASDLLAWREFVRNADRSRTRRGMDRILSSEAQEDVDSVYGIAEPRRRVSSEAATAGAARTIAALA